MADDGASLGVAEGKVKITYESTGSGAAVQQVQSMQHALDQTGASAAKSVGQFNQATAAIQQVAGAAQQLNSVKVTQSPLTAMPTMIAQDASKSKAALDRAMNDFRNQVIKGIQASAPSGLTIKPKDIKIDQTGFAKAVSDFAKAGKGGAGLQAALADTVSITPKLLLDEAKVREAGKKAGSVLNEELSAPGLWSDVEKAFTEALHTGVETISGGFGRSLRSITPTAASVGEESGGALAAGITGAVVGVVGVVATAIAAVGTVLTGGFSRLTDIDNASVKLKALGLSAEDVKSVIESAGKAVEGTALGISDSMNAAAVAINSGVKPGQDLDKYLRALSGTAALTNTSMSALGQNFQRISSEGRVSGETIRELTSQQVPALRLIAEEYGVTQQKASEMVRQGQVDFPHFIDAMSKLAPAAQAMAQTVSGSWSVLKDSIETLGAKLLAPLFNKENASDADVFAAAIQKVNEVVTFFSNGLDGHKHEIVEFWDITGKGAVLAGHVVLGAVSFISDAFIKITQVVGDTTGWLSTAFGKIAGFFGASGVAKDADDFAKSMHALGDGLRSNRDVNLQKMYGGLDKLSDGLTKWKVGADAAADANDAAGDSAGDTAPKIITLADALDKMQIKADAAQTAIEGNTEGFKKFLKEVKDKGGTDELIAQLQKTRDQFENGGYQVKTYSDAIDKMGDASVSAADKATALITGLEKIGALPGGDALKSYNEEFDKMTNYQAKIIDLTDTMGDGLANLDGTLNTSTKNGQSLIDQIEAIRQQMVTLVASKEASPDEAYSRTVQGLQQLLQNQAGFTPDVAQKVIDKYLPKDAILNSLKAKSGPEALQDLYKDNPAKLNSQLNLLTTTQDIINQIVGPDGNLHINTVLDTSDDDLKNGPVPPGAGGVAVNAAKGLTAPTPGAATDGIPVAAPGAGTPLSPEERKKLGIPDSVPPLYHPVAPGASTPNKPYAAPGNPVAPPPNALQPTDLGGLLGSGDASYGVNDTQSKQLVQLANTPDKFAKALSDNPDIAKSLQGLVDQANAQGQNMGVALAQGMLSSSDEVKKSLEQLAQLAGDYLGNSPAKYGPLSGKGWTLERGKVFTQDWASGIESGSSAVGQATSNTAQAAAQGMGKYGGGLGTGMGGGVRLDSQITGLIATLTKMSNFGKQIFDFGKTLTDLGLGAAGIANTLSGGALFPHSYRPDPNAVRKGNPLGSWSPTAQPGVDGTATGQFALAGAPGAAPGALGPNPGKQDIANYIINKALSQGYNRTQANQFLTQAVGESGLNPKISGGNQKGDEVIGTFQEKQAFSGGLSVADRGDAQKNIDAYFAQAQAHGGPAAFTDPSQFLGIDVSGGGPYHPDNAAKGDLSSAIKNAQPYIDAYGSGTAPDLPVPAAGTAPTNSVQNAPSGFSLPTTISPSGKPIYTGPDTKNTGGGIVPNAANAEAIVKQLFPGVSINNDYRPPDGFDEHSSGEAVDFAVNPGGGLGSRTPAGQAQGLALRDFLIKNASALGLQYGLFDQRQWNPNGSSSAMEDRGSVTENHGDHFHARFNSGAGVLTPADAQALLSGTPVTPGSQVGSDGVPVTITGQAGQDLSAIAGNTTLMPTMPAQLAKAFAGDPVLQSALQNPAGLNADSVVPVLQHLDALQTNTTKYSGPDDKKQNTELAQAIGGYKSGLQDQFGLKQGPSSLEQATQLAGQIGGIAGDVFGLLDQGIKVIGAGQDAADTLVRGVANTKDVGKLIDDAQSVVTLVSKGLTTAGDITSMVGSIMSVGAGADFGASGAVSAVGQILGLAGQAVAAVNTGIDIAQEVVQEGQNALGSFIQSWTGLTGSSDVKYLLDKETGQVQAYSSDNPQQRSTFNTIGRELGDNTSGSTRTSPVNYLTVYQGPGQDPRDTMDDMMFSVRQSGLGAFGYANPISN